MSINEHESAMSILLGFTKIFKQVSEFINMESTKRMRIVFSYTNLMQNWFRHKPGELMYKKKAIHRQGNKRAKIN
jgi:hypothetical protein